ncbi:MAG: hypothetical protein Q4C70_15485, partial [Planctomycetia bacterium]|nr:hypothetical protein [Planctomycetia bacterium]
VSGTELKTDADSEPFTVTLEIGDVDGTEKAEAFQILFPGGRQAIIRGADGNGVIYGTFAFLDLLKLNSETNQPEILGVEVTDWPSIPHRGRPHFVLMQQLVPGALDAYARGRINYSDVRDNPTIGVTNIYPDRAAPMGFPPGIPVDAVNVKRVIDEAHRRGMFMYACVAAATTKNAGGIIVGFDKLDEANFYENVNRTFEELLTLGADGLWLSFDDIGAGTDSRTAIENFLRLADKHGLSGRELAFTPPIGAYQKIDHPQNHELSKIPGFEKIQWYFTRVPCQADTEMCRKIRLELPPAWWHNLIHLRSGFLNNAQIAVSLRPGNVESETFQHYGNTATDSEMIPETRTDSVKIDSKMKIATDSENLTDSAKKYAVRENKIPLPAYIELHPLSAGWHAPKYENVRQVPEFTDNVMLFCIGGGFPEEYLDTAFGFWAWNPENFDWERCQDAIYSWIYGPKCAEAAQNFDAKLVELKTLYVLPNRFFQPGKDFPPRLKTPVTENRTRALQLLDELDALCDTLQKEAPSASSLNRYRLEIVYLEPMRKTLEIARFCATADFPEYDESLKTPENLDAARKTSEFRARVETIYNRLAPELKAMDAWKKRWIP